MYWRQMYVLYTEWRDAEWLHPLESYQQYYWVTDIFNTNLNNKFVTENVPICSFALSVKYEVFFFSLIFLSEGIILFITAIFKFLVFLVIWMTFNTTSS